MKTFLSHSSKDKSLVLEVAEMLRKNGVWLDSWEMDAGDSLSDKIEKGIDNAKNFAIVLSNNSVNSPWVKYELNMAIIKYLENENYRIIVIKIDDVEIPLRLKPFLRIESRDPLEISTQLQTTSNTQAPQSKVSKRSFVNRSAEIEALSNMLFESETKFINIIGLYGIGKTSLIKEALKRVYNSPIVTEINLSPAHFGSRLTLELCSKAEIEVPVDGVDADVLNRHNLLAIETLIAKNSFIIFNKIESILNDSGEFNEDFKYVISYFSGKSIEGIHPFIFLSTRWTNLNFIDKKASDFLRLKELSDKHLGYILQAEIERIDTSNKFSVENLSPIISQLHGYPLAARLISPLILKFGVPYLTKNLHVINQLKIDIAEDILAKVLLNDTETELLEILAIFENPLGSTHLRNILDCKDDDFINYIDNLVSYNLIESDGDNLTLHPLISDFYLKLVRTTDNFIAYTKKLSELAKNQLSLLQNTDERYVYWLTSACRMLFYCGNIAESRTLRSDLIGELKNAAIKLYHRRDYERSLEYCEEYLATRPDDTDILFFKARCLSRLGNVDDAIQILENLTLTESRVKQLSKYNFAIGRVYIENSQKNEDDFLQRAQYYLSESIRLSEHGTALQSMGELLYRLGKNEEAAGFIERKLAESPADPFALSIYADILWTIGKKSAAIEKIMNALSLQPKNPNFNFRAGRFLEESGQPIEAYKFYSISLKGDETYSDARLSLCNICIDLDNLEEAQIHIAHLRESLKGEKQKVLDSIIANYYIKSNELDKAEAISKNLLKQKRDVVNLGLHAKVLLYQYRVKQKKGLTIMADSYKNKALDLINEGLQLDPDNTQLRGMVGSFV